MLIASAMVSFASADGFKSKPKKVVNITYNRAIQNPELVVAMYQQLDKEFLNEVQQLYVVEVIYNRALYRILGSRQSFITFFKLNWKFAPDSKKAVRITG